jgi:hypothetical protein
MPIAAPVKFAIPKINSVKAVSQMPIVSEDWPVSITLAQSAMTTAIVVWGDCASTISASLETAANKITVQKAKSVAITAAMIA